MTFWPRAETVTNFDDPRYWSTIPDLEPTPNAMPQHERCMVDVLSFKAPSYERKY